MSFVTKKVKVKVTEEKALSLLTLEMVLEGLGTPEKIEGNQLMWACSHCEASENAYLTYDVVKRHFNCPKNTHWQAIKEEIIDRWEINKAHEKYFGDGK